MTDTAIRSISIAESAQRAARMAADTFEHAENPHTPGTDEHAQWATAYDKYFDYFITEGIDG